MVGFEDKWEYIPLGQFNIDVADRQRSTIVIKALDNMIMLDKPYSLSTLTYPATLAQIFSNICSVGDVIQSTIGFVNDDYIVPEKPVGELTLRNILGFVAELSGTFARFTRSGTLELTWYEDSGVTITPDQRSDLKMADFSVEITGVSFASVEKDENEKEIVYMVGTDEYAIDLTGNLLLQNNYEVVLPKILTNIENVLFTPFDANWNGNPAMESGDKIIHVDIDGNVYNSVITNHVYKYRGTSVLNGKALPSISRGFESSDNRIAQIIQRIEKDLGDKLTGLEEAQLQGTELIANTLGGYTTKTEDAFYIHDAISLVNSQKIWKWGLGGFGYSSNGGLTYTTGITADNSIYAKLITADMIKTGTLEGLQITGNNINANTITGRTISGTSINSTSFNSSGSKYVSSSPSGPYTGITTKSLVNDNITFNTSRYYNNYNKTVSGYGKYDESGFTYHQNSPLTNYGSSEVTINENGLEFNSTDMHEYVSGSGKILIGGGNEPIYGSGGGIVLDSVGGVVVKNNLVVENDLFINGERLDDFVVNSYSSGTTGYIQYNSGLMICNSKHYVSNVTFQKGTNYVPSWVTGDFNYPTSFVSPPTVTASAELGEALACTNRQVFSNRVNFRISTITDISGMSFYIHIIAIGRWK